MCCEANSWSTGEEFSKFLIEKRGIDESNGWTLSLKCDNEYFYLMGYDYVFDLISKLELPPGFPVSDELFLEKSKIDSNIRMEKNERNSKKYYERNQYNLTTGYKSDRENENSLNLLKENDYKNSISTENNNKYMNKNRQIRSKSTNSNTEFHTASIYSKHSTVEDNSVANESNFEKHKWSSHEEIAPNKFDSFNDENDKKYVYKDYPKKLNNSKKQNNSEKETDKYDKTQDNVFYENCTNNISDIKNMENFRFRYEPEKSCLIVNDKENFSIYENNITSTMKHKNNSSDETYIGSSNMNGKETAMIRRRHRRLYNKDNSIEETNHSNKMIDDNRSSSSTIENIKNKVEVKKKLEVKINNLSKTNSKAKNSISSN